MRMRTRIQASIRSNEANKIDKIKLLFDNIFYFVNGSEKNIHKDGNVSLYPLKHVSFSILGSYQNYENFNTSWEFSGISVIPGILKIIF